MTLAKVESAHRGAVFDNVLEVPAVTSEYELMGLVLLFAASDCDIRAFGIIVKSTPVRRFHFAIFDIRAHTPGRL